MEQAGDSLALSTAGITIPVAPIRAQHLARARSGKRLTLGIRPEDLYEILPMSLQTDLRDFQREF